MGTMNKGQTGCKICPGGRVLAGPDRKSRRRESDALAAAKRKAGVRFVVGRASAGGVEERGRPAIGWPGARIPFLGLGWVVKCLDPAGRVVLQEDERDEATARRRALALSRGGVAYARSPAGEMTVFAKGRAVEGGRQLNLGLGQCHAGRHEKQGAQ
jgi:hypothetical protein